MPSSALPRKFDADWVLPQSEGQQAAKAAASLLVCRRLRLQMLRPPPPAPTTPASGSGARPAAPSGDAAEERSPMHVAEEALDGYREGQTFELDRLDRIVCGVVTPHGRHTRYFVLHKYVLLLVQPDLCSPGKVSIRTLVPLRCVTLEAPSADPRTLRLGVWLPRGSAKPGEASAADEDEPSDTSEARRALLLVAAEDQREKQTLFILTLSFEET
ncbi:unnamed protein product [Prorocentrum cordatum]|uniref:Uncharacterized protein n=1 Tax=Prorocentrum cordatum TaxID=2364126 RepID=A0ABN9Q718_9DINO|nr:unnamed protein product [Polarella glacialis]